MYCGVTTHRLLLLIRQQGALSHMQCRSHRVLPPSWDTPLTNEWRLAHGKKILLVHIATVCSSARRLRNG